MIKFELNNATQAVDIVRTTGNIETDETLYASVYISLFTRRRALDDDELPDNSTDRAGWWADPYADVSGHLIGSRLWLLSRSKATHSVLLQAQNYALESLQWMIDDGVASSISVEVERVKNNVLGFKVSITKPNKPSIRWEAAWKAHLALL